MTVYKVTAGEGAQYSQSFLKGKLRKGQCLVVTNWRNTGLDLVITAHDVNTAVTPGHASVGITFGPPTPTQKPSLKPTNVCCFLYPRRSQRESPLAHPLLHQ